LLYTKINQTGTELLQDIYNNIFDETVELTREQVEIILSLQTKVKKVDSLWKIDDKKRRG
jgi:hypothetical protein